MYIWYSIYLLYMLVCHLLLFLTENEPPFLQMNHLLLYPPVFNLKIQMAKHAFDMREWWWLPSDIILPFLCIPHVIVLMNKSCGMGIPTTLYGFTHTMWAIHHSLSARISIVPSAAEGGGGMKNWCICLIKQSGNARNSISLGNPLSGPVLYNSYIQRGRLEAEIMTASGILPMLLLCLLWDSSDNRSIYKGHWALNKHWGCCKH